VTQRRLFFRFIALFGLCCALPLAAEASGGGATSVRTVSPVDGSGQLKPGYRVTRHFGHATCQSGSYMTGTADRCTTPESRGVVLDPCWPTSSAQTFVCQGKPWEHKVVELEVTQPPSGGPGQHHQGLPWGMRIGARVRCLLDPGSVRRVNGHPLLFHCTHHRDVFGLRRNSPRWTAHVYRSGARTSSGYRSLGWQHVAIAWYGAPARSASPSPSPTPTLPLLTSESPSPSPTS
jgi:hypothetical protein